MTTATSHPPPRHRAAPAAAPRHFLPEATLPGGGLPGERLARTAARQAFLELKHGFVDAVAALGGGDAGWLQQQLRRAAQPVDLWLLRGPLFDVLGGDEPERRLARQRLSRGLETLFPDLMPISGFELPACARSPAAP